MSKNTQDQNLYLLRVIAAAILYSGGATQDDIASVLHISKGDAGKLVKGMKKNDHSK